VKDKGMVTPNLSIYPCIIYAERYWEIQNYQGRAQENHVTELSSIISDEVKMSH
jgi:hypothetical protein